MVSYSSTVIRTLISVGDMGVDGEFYGFAVQDSNEDWLGGRHTGPGDNRD